MAPRDQQVCVAKIGAAHGVRGEVRLWPFTADPLAVTLYGPLQSEDGRTFEIEAVRPAKDFLVARLKNVSDRAAAERLCNVELFVPRDRLPELGEEEFYHADLIGAAVEDQSGTVLGTIMAVHNFGAGDLLEVRPAGGGDTVMVPFTETTVPSIDLARGRVVMVPPEELSEAAGESTHRDRSEDD
jgi:16S rRNA processing protein RimM